MTAAIAIAGSLSTGFRGVPGDRVTFPSGLEVEVFARANLPTEHGALEMVAFKNNADGLDHVAVIHGDVVDQENVSARVHSECLTGDVFSSRKCDCGPQLHAALDAIQGEPCGVVFYMRQEGRGIGLANKIKAYSLQDRGFDTVEANLHLGFDDDLREYDIAAAMVHLLGIRSVTLYTNNPRKVAGLRENGVIVSQRTPLQITPNEYNEHYLRTKRAKSGHLLDV